MAKSTLNPFTGQPDLIGNSSGGGGSTTKYEVSITTGSWSLVSGMYEYNITQSTHGLGTEPMVQTYELISGSYEVVQPVVIINGSGDVKIQVTSSPDLRFDGKILLI